MTWEQALIAGYTGRIVCPGYRAWIKTLACDNCQINWGCDCSHYNGLKGAGTKAPDLLSVPHCRACHEAYERLDGEYDPQGRPFLSRVAIYLLRAFWEGRLVWTRTQP